MTGGHGPTERRWLHWAVIVVLLAVVVSARGAVARADSASAVNFDNLPAGTVVGDQFRDLGGVDHGVAFGPTPLGKGSEQPMIADVGASLAHSGTQIGELTTPTCPTGEACRTPDGFMFFPVQTSSVTMFVGAFGTITDTITVRAFGADGAQIGSTMSVIVTGGMGFSTRVGIADPSASIFYVEVRGSTLAPIAMDDLTFTHPAVSLPPSFQLQGGGTLAVAQGGSTDTVIILTRQNGSVAPVIFSATSPPGVNVRFMPNPASNPNGDRVAMTVTAVSNAPPTSGSPLVVTAMSSGLEPTQSLTYTLAVVVVPILRADGLDVFQTVQTPGDLPAGQTRVYRGVTLVAGKRALVRMYADAVNASLAGVSFGDVTLTGLRNGQMLPGSPLYPLDQPVLTDEHRAGGVSAATRGNPSAAFSFILPQAWELGTITLVAQLTSAVAPPPIGQVPCFGPACITTLTGVRFVPTRSFEINPIELTVAGLANPPPPQTVFAQAAQVGPFSDQGLIVRPYQAAIDVTDQVNHPRDAQHPCGLPHGATVPDFNCMGLREAGIWDRANGEPFDATVSVASAGGGIADSVPGRVAQVGSDRPLTAVAHELGHLYGRFHASRACGGGGEPWPPDQFGYLQGIGYDTTAGSAAAAGESGMFRAMFGSPPTGTVLCANPPLDCGNPAPTDYFDFMSYCAEEASAWISPKGWMESLCDLNPGASGCPALSNAQARDAAAPRGGSGQLVVTAFGEGGVGMSIGDVQPAAGLMLEPGAVSSMRVISRNAEGRVLDSEPLVFEAGHIDPTLKQRVSEPFLTLQGFVRAAGADSVSIEDGAKILATRVRPPRRPSIKRLAPVGGENTGQRKPVTIRWLATDADKLALEITISYSADNGRKFQIIWTGPNTGSVQLPSRMLPFSNHARVKIEASDGFNTSTAVSNAFHALGAPPAVMIAAPQPRVAQPNDAALLLEGSAFDDAGRQLTGGRLRWFDGDRPLGTGSSLSVSGLAAAVHKIRLTATDRIGRKATATVQVTLRQAPPSLIAVAVPVRITNFARVLKITVTASIPCRLTVAGRGAKPVAVRLSARRPTRVTVKISPSSGILRLELSLTAGRFTTTSPLLIIRAPLLPH